MIMYYYMITADPIEQRDPLRTTPMPVGHGNQGGHGGGGMPPPPPPRNSVGGHSRNIHPPSNYHPPVHHPPATQ